MYMIVYTLKNCVRYLKNVYVECTESRTLFENLCTLNLQNYVHCLKNVYVEFIEFRIIL